MYEMQAREKKYGERRNGRQNRDGKAITEIRTVPSGQKGDK